MAKIEIRSHEDDSVLEVREVAEGLNVEKVERGMNINLDHASFYTRIVEDMPAATVPERTNPAADPMDPRASYVSGKDLDATGGYFQDEPDLPMTCGTCGHRYADDTPAGRCPKEDEHETPEERRRLTILIETEGAWIRPDDDGPVDGHALADTLGTVANKIRGLYTEGVVFDANGVRVGTWSLT